MKIYPIATNTFNSHKSITFRNNPETVVTPAQTQDVTQFKNVSGTNLKKVHSKSFVSKLNAFLKPVDGIEKTDPRYSESPWIRSFLY